MAELPELLETFRERDYVVVRGFYPLGLVEGYRAHLETALERDVWPLFKELGFDPADPSLGRRVGERLLQDESLSPEVRQVLLGHFPLAVRLSEAIKPIAAHLGGSALLRSLLGSEGLFMHMPPMARFVPPGYGPAAVPPHQDLNYNTHMTDFLTVWTPLVKIDEQCGGLVVFEGSQHRLQAVDPTESGWLSAMDVTGFERLQLVGVGPGDAVLLSPRIGHASAPNLSDRLRLSMDLRVFGAAASSTKHHMNLQTLKTVGA